MTPPLLVKRILVAVSLASSLLATSAHATDNTLVMASTTSTEQSGLFAHLLPAFTTATGISVKVVAAGTGQAIDMARRGDADVLFVHDPVAEDKFVAQGFSDKRSPVMYNDFVVLGIAAANAGFISRGDNSGTNNAELRFWVAAGQTTKGAGYKACGCGMGPALNMASASNAYVMSDRATWLNFKNKGDLKILVQGDERLFNQYGVMVVSPTKHPHLNTQAAQTFANWVVSAAGQASIASYTVAGEQLFFPNAKP
jgi:tungstate transport system substrate-binding protein